MGGRRRGVEVGICQGILSLVSLVFVKLPVAGGRNSIAVVGVEILVAL